MSIQLESSVQRKCNKSIMSIVQEMDTMKLPDVPDDTKNQRT